MSQKYEIRELPNGTFQIRYRDEMKQQRAKNFTSKEKARHWRRIHLEGARNYGGHAKTLEEVIDEWRMRVFPTLAETTRVNYENKIRLHFGPLLPMEIHAITPRTLDLWIDHMRREVNRYGKAGIRQNFRQELKTLTTVLHYYAEYADDEAFQFPVKERHRKAVILRSRPKVAAKDLSETHFKLFADELCYGPGGEQMKALATIQFYHALRISEVAALHWEDVHFDPEPRRSRLVVTRHVLYLRKAGLTDRLEAGFKNSEGQAGLKEHPLMPASYQALRELWGEGKAGLIFRNPRTGGFWSYRTIQARFNRAFRDLKLPYRSTHVMRHGGTRRMYDQTGGDIGVAQQLLGNADRKTVDVYAKRSAGALTQAAASEWARDGCALEVHARGVRLSLVKKDE